jgi:hypothetical protein
MKITSSAKILTAGTIIILGIFLFATTGCKSPENPQTEIIANIFVSNECGLALDIYSDGVYQFSLEFLHYDIIESVSSGVHEIVAKEKDTEEAFATQVVNITESKDHWVTFLYTASIKVVNEYGEALNIYTNGSLQGELGDGENQVFTNVPYGDHVIEASTVSDNTLVASVTISVVEEKEYTWTIK